LNFHVPTAVSAIAPLRAAVIAVSQADDVHVAGELARGEHRDLVRLAPGVREVTDRQPAVRRQVLGEPAAEFADRRVQIDRCHVLKRAELLAHAARDLRVAVPDRHAHDSGEAIEVALAGFVPEVLHVALDHEQRVAVVGPQAGREELLAKREHFRARRPVVGPRDVIGDRQFAPNARRGGSRVVIAHVDHSRGLIASLRLSLMLANARRGRKL